MTRRVRRIAWFASLLLALPAGAADTSGLVRHGVADLRKASFNSLISLDGDWSFARQQVLGPEAAFPAQWVKVPGRWDFDRKSSMGYASYRLKILLPEDHPPLALRVPDIHSAWRLWINGDPMAHSGTFGVTAEAEKPGLGTRLCELPDVPQITLVWQVSNFSHLRAGSQRSVLIGRFDQLHRQAVRREVLLLLGGSVYMLLAGYFFSLGIRGNSLGPQALFAVPTGLLGLELLLSSNALGALIQGVPAQVWFRAEQISYIGLIPAYLGFSRRVYPSYFHPLAERCVLILGLALVAATLLLSVPWNERLRWLYMGAFIPAAAYVMGGLHWACMEKKPEAGTLLMAGAALLAAVAVDELVAVEFNFQWHVYSYVAMAWVIVHGVVLLRMQQRRRQRDQTPFSGEFVRAIQRETSQLVAKVDALEGALQDAACHTDERTDLMVALGHDLRTPMNGVLGAAQALKRSGLQGESKDLVDLIVYSGRNMNAMLGQLLDLCRGRAPVIKLNRGWFDLPRLLHNSLALVGAQARRGELELKLETVNVPQKWYGDELRLQEVLLNLLGNAVKFSHGGVITLRVVFAKNPVVGQFRIEVVDSGPPIAEDQRERIFEAYFQGQSATTEGVGLGLHICKTLVEKMDGRIESCATTVGGNCFRIWLPIDSAEGLAGVESVQPAVACSVLLVDDEALNHAVMKAICKQRGYRFRSAYNAQHAVAQLDADIDLILIDLNLPGMNGVELAAAIRARQDFIPRKPQLVLCSGGELPGDLPYGKEYFDDYLPKPVVDEDFSRLIARLSGENWKLACASGPTLARIQADLGPVACREIVAEGRRSLQKAMADLQAAAPRRAMACVEGILHRVKSTAATLGLAELEAGAVLSRSSTGLDTTAVCRLIRRALLQLDSLLARP